VHRQKRRAHRRLRHLELERLASRSDRQAAHLPGIVARRAGGQRVDDRALRLVRHDPPRPSGLSQRKGVLTLVGADVHDDVDGIRAQHQQATLVERRDARIDETLPAAGGKAA